MFGKIACNPSSSLCIDRLVSDVIIRIATRKSPLALWQAYHVYDLLRTVDRSLKVFLVPVKTEAEKDLSIPISEIGGKGSFSKGVQKMLLTGRADIAVHSAKDLQSETPHGLTIGAFPVRGEAHDVLVGSTLEDLPEGATVATGSSRRRALLLDLRPDLSVIGLRGNIDTRLTKLSEADAIVTAACALNRLGKKLDIVDDLDTDTFTPQVGQGALAVETRADDYQILDLLAAVDHLPTRNAVEAERSFLSELGADCTFPAAAYATRYGNSIKIQGFLASETRTLSCKDEEIGLPESIPGKLLAKKLKQKIMDEKE